MWLRLSLLLGGIFNVMMGAIFVSDDLLDMFFDLMDRAESYLFGLPAYLSFPADPVHLMLIQGFGAAALILGVTLLYCANHAWPYRHFILFDGAGRIGYASLMFYFILRFQLPRVIAIFAAVEMIFGAMYIAGFFRLKKETGMS